LGFAPDPSFIDFFEARLEQANRAKASALKMIYRHNELNGGRSPAVGPEQLTEP
jgi:hypothetical protein